MEYYKKILGLLFIFTLALTAFAQQSPPKNIDEKGNQNDLWVGRTHYEDDLILDNFTITGEPETDIINPVNKNTDQAEIQPRGYKLYDNYPNPFNPVTTIKYSIPESGLVTLSVYDILGKEVSTPVSTLVNAGSHEVRFDASSMASGLYFYKISVNNFTDVKKMILVK